MVRERGADDARWMRRALELAERGRGRVSPNPLVGAVVVRDGERVGEGWHAEFGGPHAEVVALRDAGKKARGATLYLTLEPCAHQGKTPPCSEAILRAGISRMVFAIPDPHPPASGGAAIVANGGVVVRSGVEEERARDLNAAFLHRFGPERDRPWTVLKLALSIDGRMADRDRRSGWITAEEARREVHRERADMDAIAVGVGTVLEDDPRLTVRGDIVPRKPPTRVVFDRQLRLPLDSRLVRTAEETPVIAITSREAGTDAAADLRRAGVDVIVAADLRDGLRQLRERGVSSLYLEGGAVLAGTFVSEGLADRLHLYLAPLLLGPEGLHPFAGIESPSLGAAARWRRLETKALGEDTLIRLARD